MSVYFIKGKGWRYDFTRRGERHTAAWFETKAEAREAEADKRKELRQTRLQPVPTIAAPTDMGFLEMVNRRLDHVRAYCSEQHYAEYRSRAKRWVKLWGGLPCKEITAEMIEQFVLQRSKVSAFTANKEICCLRATFNFALKKGWIESNPTAGIDRLPQARARRYLPSDADIEKVIAAAKKPRDRDYLIAIRDTMARSVEINRLAWDDIDFEAGAVTLWTRKKKGGHLTPRKVPMTARLCSTLERRFAEREHDLPWVFWHRHYSKKAGKTVAGPYRERKKFMKTLCKKAGVRYFRFHALRHAGASAMERNGVPIGSIQKILGHESRITTETYLHTVGQSEREAIAIFERSTKKSHTKSHTDGKPRLRLVK